jgi:hypothetical protein
MRVRVVHEWWVDDRYVIEVKPTFWSQWRRADDSRYADHKWCIHNAKKIKEKGKQPYVIWTDKDKD